MFGWFRNVSSSEAIEDLKRRLTSSQKDADYWRNEYGNKVAELVEAKEKAELERGLNEATIKDLQKRNEELEGKRARLDLDLHASRKSLENIKSSRTTMINIINDYVPVFGTRMHELVKECVSKLSQEVSKTVP